MKEGNVLFNDALNTFYLRLLRVSPVNEMNLIKFFGQLLMIFFTISGDILYDIQLLNSSGGLLSSREILAGHQLIVIFDISKDGKYAVVLSAFNMAIIKRSEVIKHVVDVANPGQFCHCVA